jgi:hypothetical protein
VAFTLLMNRHESERGRCDSSARLLLCDCGLRADLRVPIWATLSSFVRVPIRPTLLAAVTVGRVALVFNGRDECSFNGEVADRRLRETDNSSAG